MKDNLIVLQSPMHQRGTPELLRTTFDLYYTAYLDRPGQERQFQHIRNVKPAAPAADTFALLEPLIARFVIDGYSAGQNFMVHAPAQIPACPEAAHYLERQLPFLSSLLKTYLSHINETALTPGQEPIQHAVYDFLYEISKVAYYDAVQLLFKRISA